MVFVLTPLGQIQKQPATQLTQTLTTVGLTSTVVYTCPSGKKATINQLSDMGVALGANTNIHMKVKGQNLHNISGAELTITDEHLTGVTLIAGDKIEAVGDNAGNNGTINLFCSVTELPA